MEEQMPKQEDIYNLSGKQNRRRPKKTDPDWWMVEPPEKHKTGPPKRRYGRGLNPNSHKKGRGGGPKGRPRAEGAGRKPSGKVTTSIMVRLEVNAEKRLSAEADRRGVSRSELIRQWIETLPSVTE